MSITNWIMLVLFAALVVCVIILMKGCNQLPQNTANKHFVDSITQKAEKDSAYAIRYIDSMGKLVSSVRRSNDSLHTKQKSSEVILNKEGRKVVDLLSKLDSLQHTTDTISTLQACADLRQTLVNDSALLIGYEVMSDSLIDRLKLERGQSDTVKNRIFGMFTESNSQTFEISRKYSILDQQYRAALKKANKRFSIGPSVIAGLINGKFTVVPGIGISYSLIKF